VGEYVQKAAFEEGGVGFVEKGEGGGEWGGGGGFFFGKCECIGVLGVVNEVGTGDGWFFEKIFLEEEEEFFAFVVDAEDMDLEDVVEGFLGGAEVEHGGEFDEYAGGYGE
jgi:hypothetical protein